MTGEIRVDFVGNLTKDPEIRFNEATGIAVAKFRVACTESVRNRQTNQWEDGNTTFLSVEAWRNGAENVVETLKKGMAVVVVGKLRAREYETANGEKRLSVEVYDANVGPDLSWASAEVTRNARNGGGSAPATSAAPPAAAPPAQRATAPTGGPGRVDEPPF